MSGRVRNNSSGFSRRSSVPPGPDPVGAIRRLHLLWSVPYLVLAAALSAHPATQATTVVVPCDKKLLKPTADPLAYSLRGERCEGVYVREVAGTGGFSVAAFTSSLQPFNITSGAPLLIEWSASSDTPVYLRAVSLRRKLYYRMDTQRPVSTRRFEWPTDVLVALNLRSEELGIVGWIEGRIGEVDQDVYVPIRIAAAAAGSGEDRYVLQIVPGMELQEVFVSLASADASGRDETVLLRNQPVKRGFYPAERPIPIRLPKLPRPGLYRIQLNAVLSSGSPSSRSLYFQHTGG